VIPLQYVDASVPPYGQVSDDEMAALLYEYTVGD
jgi:hypothetical protein